MNAGFFERRVTPEFPVNQPMLDVAKWQREHQVGKPSENSNLSELDKLRAIAVKGELY